MATDHLDEGGASGDDETPDEKPEFESYNPVEQQEGLISDELRDLLQTPAGVQQALDMWAANENPNGLFDLTEEGKNHFKHGNRPFVMQVMLGEFDLEKPLTDDEEAELLTTQDARRRWMLDTRKRLSNEEQDE